MRVRIFETGDSDHAGLHDFDTEVVPQIGDLITLEGHGHPTSYFKVVNRALRVDTSTDPGKEAVFYVGIEVSDAGGSTTLTRLFR